MYQSTDVPGRAYIGDTLQLCVSYGTIAGVFFTPSETKVTTVGSVTTVKVAGGVCVIPGFVHYGNECVRNPSFTVQGSAVNYSDPWYGSGTLVNAALVPCVDTTSPYAYPGYSGTTLGAACVYAGASGKVGFDRSRKPTMRVQPGFCVRTKALTTCVSLTSQTNADLGSAAQSVCTTVGDGVLCRGAVVVCTTETIAGESPAPKADCDVVPTS
ncbi:MAG: hypothetical protein M3394_01320 [Actinomycetota bacterium]|nr:hypothetical protein [Actinomycetota bacterium]